MKSALVKLALDSSRRDFLSGRNLLSAATAATALSSISARAASTDKTDELIYIDRKSVV